MSEATFALRLRAKFWNKLQEKTGWGRNQVMEQFDKALLELSEEDKKNHPIWPKK